MLFTQIVEKLIKDRGITKSKMLKDLKLGVGTFATWESRGTIPGGEIIAKLADYFCVSTDYLLGKTDEPKPIEELHDEVDEYLDILHKRGDMRMLFSVAKNATKEDIERAAIIIESLIKKERGEE